MKKVKQKTIESKEPARKTKIKVVGIGGGGGSIVAEIAQYVKRADFVAANTDFQALNEIKRKARVFQFGQSLTGGLGCGMEPRIGQKAAREAKQKIANLFKDVDFAVLVSSLGGGTGSGSAPEFARILKDLGVMTFGIFTLPFKFEGVKRAQIARASLEKLTPYLNALSVIPNENIFQIINKDTPIIEAFSAVNKHLSENLRGLVEMIYSPGLVNIDFADLKTILEGRGKLAYLNSAEGQGENRAEGAVKELLKSPLNEYGIGGTEKILFNITASKDLGMREVEMISRTISDFNRRAKIIFGVSQDNAYGDKLRITILAVGCCIEEPKKLQSKVKPPEKKPKTLKPSKIKKRIVPKKVKSPARLRLRANSLAGGQKSKVVPAGHLSKGDKSQKIKVKVGVKTVPIAVEQPPLARKNALDLKKEAEETEQEFLEQEKKWDVPAFLRRQENQ